MTSDQLQLVEAYAPGHRQHEVLNESYPVLVPDEKNRTQGLLIDGLTELAMQRIQFFEGDEYILSTIDIETADNANLRANYYKDAGVYSILETVWNFQQWQVEHKPTFVEKCEKYMQLFGKMNATEADQFW